MKTYYVNVYYYKIDENVDRIVIGRTCETLSASQASAKLLHECLSKKPYEHFQIRIKIKSKIRTKTA